jgi:hypothetical protein
MINLQKNNYLGVAGIVSHSPDVTNKYNALLELLKTDGILEQVERWMDDEDFTDLIQHIEDNLKENGISLPY